MSDDVRRGRELDILRRQYRDHREALTRMAADAPSEPLAAEYTRLIANIDSSLAKLDELESASQRRGTSPGTAAAPVPAAGSVASRASGEPLRDESQPLSRPLLGVGESSSSLESPEPDHRGDNKFVLMLVLGIPVLALLGYLAWRASTSRDSVKATEPVAVSEAAPETNTVRPIETGTVRPVATPPQPAREIVIAPAAVDFGVVGKGTRAVRQIEVTNKTGQPLDFQVARSQCKCLYYEYKSKLAANQKETLTITLDAAKAPAGAVQEAIAITSKNDASLSASVQISATVQ